MLSHETYGKDLKDYPPQSSTMSKVPNYQFTLSFEDNFNIEFWLPFCTQFYPLSLVIAGIYLYTINYGRKYMEKRPAYDLRGIQTLWNLGLAGFSVLAATRTFPEMYHTFRHFGFKATYCSDSLITENPVSLLWSILFCASKVLELADTAFIVLRKKNLSFLHWFHHSTVLVGSWFGGRQQVAMGRWFMNMNLAVHMVMYFYFALKSMGFRIPKFVKIGITTAQCTQIVIAFFISLLAFRAYFAGEDCAISGFTVAMCLFLFPAYFALFSHFFYQEYIAPTLTNNLKKDD